MKYKVRQWLLQKLSLYLLCVHHCDNSSAVSPEGFWDGSPGCQTSRQAEIQPPRPTPGARSAPNPPPLQVPRRQSRSWRRGMAVTADRRASNSKGSAPGLRTPGSLGLASTAPTPRSRSKRRIKSAESLRLAIFKQFSSFALKRSLWEAVCHI